MDGDIQLRVGAALLLIHESISRGIHMAGLYSRIFSRMGFPGGRIGPGFTDYVHSLASVLHAHHIAEDTIAFPLLRKILPDAPYDQLSEEHLKIIPLVDELRLKIGQAGDGPGAGEALARTDTLLSRLAEIWRPHIAVEEVHFSAAKVDSVMSPGEQAALLADIGESNLKHSGPDYLVVPFTLFNLPPEGRSAMGSMMPTMVTRHLVPVVWKEKWQAMSPFLLV